MRLESYFIYGITYIHSQPHFSATHILLKIFSLLQIFPVYLGSQVTSIFFILVFFLVFFFLIVFFFLVVFFFFVVFVLFFLVVVIILTDFLKFSTQGDIGLLDVHLIIDVLVNV